MSGPSFVPPHHHTPDRPVRSDKGDGDATSNHHDGASPDGVGTTDLRALMTAGGNTGMLGHVQRSPTQAPSGGDGSVDVCEGSAGPPKQAIVTAWLAELQGRVALLEPWLDNLDAGVETAIQVATASRSQERESGARMAAIAEAMKNAKHDKFFASMIDFLSGVKGLIKGVSGLMSAFKANKFGAAVGETTDVAVGGMKGRKAMGRVVPGASVDGELAGAIQMVSQYSQLVASQLGQTLGVVAGNTTLNITELLSTVGARAQSIATALEASAQCPPGSIHGYPVEFVSAVTEQLSDPGLVQRLNAAGARFDRLEMLAGAIAAGGGSALTEGTPSRTLFDQLAAWRSSAPEKLDALELTTYGEEAHVSLSTATVWKKDPGSGRQVFAHEATVERRPRARITGNLELIAELAKIMPTKVGVDEVGIELDDAQQAAVGTLGVRERQGDGAAYVAIDGQRVLTLHGAARGAAWASAPEVEALCAARLDHPTVAIDGRLVDIGRRTRDYVPRVLGGEGLDAL